jgi:hypothetical protein
MKNNQGVLYWTTSKEIEPVKYEIQKSKEEAGLSLLVKYPGTKIHLLKQIAIPILIRNR